MVQVYESVSAVDYWKIPDYGDYTASQLRTELDNRGHEHLQRSTRQRLQQQAIRAFRGLLSYEKRPIKELRSLATQWGVDPQGLTKADIVKALEHADKDQTFHRFLDLPPELRLLVYDFYLQPLTQHESYVGPYGLGNENMQAVVQPPVTRVCRLLRDEALPLFYEKRTLVFNVGSTLRMGQTYTHTGHLLPSKANVIRQFRSFRIGFNESLVVEHSSRVVPFFWDVKLPHNHKQDGGGYKIVAVQRRFPDTEKSAEIASIDELMEEHLKEVVSRACGKCVVELTIDDIVALADWVVANVRMAKRGG